MFLDLAKILTVLSALSPPLFSTTPSISALSALGANISDNPVVFNIGVSNTIGLLKP